MVKFAVEFWWKMLLTIFPSKRSSKQISFQTLPEVRHQFRRKLRQLHSGNRSCLGFHGFHQAETSNGYVDISNAYMLETPRGSLRGLGFAKKTSRRPARRPQTESNPTIHAPPLQKPWRTSPVRSWGWCTCCNFCCSLRFWQFVHHPFRNPFFYPKSFVVSTFAPRVGC